MNDKADGYHQRKEKYGKGSHGEYAVECLSFFYVYHACYAMEVQGQECQYGQHVAVEAYVEEVSVQGDVDGYEVCGYDSDKEV